MRLVNTLEKIDSVSRLPQEVAVRIFGFLTPVELWYATNKVCRSWQDIARDNWEDLIDFSKENAKDKATELGSFQELFIKHPEYRKTQYRAIDKRGREWCEVQAEQHFDTICEYNRNRWTRVEHEKYHREFEALYKDHPWITQALNIVCSVSYCIPGTYLLANNRPNHYVKAFNYLYEKNVLNTKTLAYIAACVDDKALSKQFCVADYAHFIVLFFRAGILNDENLIAIKTSFNPNNFCANALGLLLEGFKGEDKTGKRQQNFAIYRDKILELARVDQLGNSLEAYTKCIVNLYTNGILLSSPAHRVIYDELLKLDSIRAHSYSDSYVILHKANLLVEPGCKLLRDLLLKNPSEQGDWRAAAIILNYLSGTLKQYVCEEFEKLDIDPKTVRQELEELEKFHTDLNTVRKAVEELEKLCINSDTIKKALKLLSGICHGPSDAVESFKEIVEHYQSGPLRRRLFEGSQKPTEFDSVSEQSKALAVIHDDSSHNDSGRYTKFDIRCSSFNMFANPPAFDEDTPSTKISVISPDDRPLTNNEKEFKAKLFRVLRVKEDVEIFFNALRKDYTNENSEIIRKFLLNQDNPREIFLNRDYGAAAIAELHGNAQLAFFIRMAAKLDCMLYEDKHSLLKRLPLNDFRTKAAEVYLHQNYRLWAYNILGGYIINEKSPTEDDKESFRRHWDELNSAFFHKKYAPGRYAFAKSIADDRTQWSKARREIAMVLLNVVLALSIVGIAAIVYHHRNYGCIFFGATKSKQKLNHMKKKVLHHVTESSSKQSKNVPRIFSSKKTKTAEAFDKNGFLEGYTFFPSPSY